MATRTISFTYERSTKNTHVYVEVGTAVVGTLYLQKSAFDSQPTSLKVTIETE